MSSLLRAQACVASTNSPSKSPVMVVPRVQTRVGAVRSLPVTSGYGRRSVVVCARSSGNAGVLDNPLTLPGREKSLDHSKKKPPTYKVMLHNDNYNRREYVVKVLLKVVAGITMDDAVVVMQEAHETGVAMVIACPQEDAERYCESLRLNGLTSTIEPGGK
mmetsp:Transcript_5161/g.12706  ORF Transcript_5161/g.12706 Transcript_5161/m.12706 type:complete len:161 (-) Transcript_5161:2840-3322(-)